MPFPLSRFADFGFLSNELWGLSGIEWGTLLSVLSVMILSTQLSIVTMADVVKEPAIKPTTYPRKWDSLFSCGSFSEIGKCCHRDYVAST